MTFTNIKQCRSAESVDWGLSMLGKRDFYLKKNLKLLQPE
jgi:hypothetical protein